MMMQTLLLLVLLTLSFPTNNGDMINTFVGKVLSPSDSIFNAIKRSITVGGQTAFSIQGKEDKDTYADELGRRCGPFDSDFESKGCRPTSSLSPWYKWNGDMSVFGSSSYKVVDIGDVIIAAPAVTSQTVLSMGDGDDGNGSDDNGDGRRLAGVTNHAVLVSDPKCSHKDTFSILSVDLATEEVRGIVFKYGGKSKRLIQRKGRETFVEDIEEEGEFALEDVEEKEDIETVERGYDRTDDGEANDQLFEHHIQDHYTPHDQLRGTRRLQDDGNSPANSYDYEVKLFIEIDQDFINTHGGQEEAINYIDTLIGAANSIFEREVSTHFVVAQVNLTDRYDEIDTALNALNDMKNHFDDMEHWNETGVGLHHAMLGKKFSGVDDGRSYQQNDNNEYVAVMCNKDFGYGVSSKYGGNFKTISEAVVFDLYILMHELGHNFGMHHTHENFNPFVDKCFPDCPNIADSSFPERSATIMSYCHKCGRRGFKNIALTFGGEWSGTGDRSVAGKWIDSSKINFKNVAIEGTDTTISNDPKRVPFRMWNRIREVGTRVGSCIERSATAPSSATTLPTHSPTKVPTAIPANNPTAVPTKKPTNGGGPQTAIYDSTLGVPKCGSIGISCDSGPSLLLGVGDSGPEPNQPNSLDTCIDGRGGTFHDDESIGRILVKTVDGTNLAPGTVARIEATVWAYGDGSEDSAHFYYASDASNPNWEYISTSTPPGGKARIVTAQYIIPSGGTAQAVRVYFHRSGNEAPVCSGVDFGDSDDLVFVVV